MGPLTCDYYHVTTTCLTDFTESGSGALIFSVEIPRENNSLGLTISGKEQTGQPIVISEITPGGIAER